MGGDYYRDIREDGGEVWLHARAGRIWDSRGDRLVSGGSLRRSSWERPINRRVGQGER